MFKIFPKNNLQLFTKLPLKIAVFAILITLSMSVYGQRTLGRVGLSTSTSGGITKTALTAAATLDQCANGPVDAHASCTGANWVNGNVNQAKAHWAESQSLVYRMQMTGLSTSGSHTLIIGYDILKSGTHAIDYLTSFDRTETTVGPTADNANMSDPCFGFGCTTLPLTSPNVSQASIPTDNETVTNKFNADHPTLSVPQVPGVFTMWGGTIATVSYVCATGDCTSPSTYTSGDERRISITFTATSANVLLAWGGHVAWQGDWGVGLSAGGISGSPYHCRLISLDGAGGNQDRSLSAAATALPVASLTINKFVPFALSSTVTFNFGTSGADLAGFNLSPVTVSSTQSTDTKVFPITTALTGNLADQRTIQEITTTLPHGWKVTGLGCANTGPNGTASIASVSSAAQISSGIAIATLAPIGTDNITCNFTNSIVTAALATITGRVTTASGYGISGAVITANDANTGARVTVLTNPFGYYTVSNLPVNDFYVVSVSSKRYTFSNSTQSFVLNDNYAGLNFVADF